MKNFVKKNIKFILFCLFFIILNMLFLNNIFLDNETLNYGKEYFIILILSVLVEILVCIIAYKMKEKNIKIEKIYLLLATTIGSMYLILIPVGVVPDENAHLERAYELSMGHMISEKDNNGVGGGVLPVELVTKIPNAHNYKYSTVINNLTKKNSGKTIFIGYPNSALYNIFCYVPQTIGILIGRLLNLPVLLTAYLGRIITFIFHIFIVYFSIKHIPLLKNFVMGICLLPITLQEAMSLSPDSMIIAFSIALVSFILYCKYEKKDKLNKKEYIIMTLLTLFISLLKIVYIPLCLLLLIIPEERFKNKRDKYIKIFIIIFVGCILNAVWLSLASGFLSEVKPGVKPDLQTKYVLTHPFIYIKILFNTVIKNGLWYIYTLFGGALGFFNIFLSHTYIIFVIFTLLYELSKFRDGFKKFDRDKFLTIFVLILIVVLIFSSLYVQWTEYKNIIVDGVQGRYFIPIMFLIPLLLANNDINEKLEKSNVYLNLFIIFFNIYALITIFLNCL